MTIKFEFFELISEGGAPEKGCTFQNIEIAIEDECRESYAPSVAVGWDLYETLHPCAQRVVFEIELTQFPQSLVE